MDISNSSVQAKEQEVELCVLQDALAGQREDISLLCSIVEYLKSHKNVRLDHGDSKRLTEKMNALKLRQINRYEVLDIKINENLKNKKTSSCVLIAFAKEIRKLESGLRTLMLFTGDVIEMLKEGSTIEDRVDDRIYYFDKRSCTLENEMCALQSKMATI